MKLSARNQFKGKVVDIQEGAVNGIVKIDIGGGNVMSATISMNAIKELGLAQMDVFFLEVQVTLLRDGNEVDVGMRHFQANYSHADAFARHSLFDGLGHFFGKDHHGPDFVVIEVEDIVVFVLGHYQCMPFHHRIDIQESKETLVFGNFIARDIPFYDF